MAVRWRNAADGMESIILPSNRNSSKVMRPRKLDSTKAEMLLRERSNVRRDRRPQNECLPIAGMNELVIFSSSSFVRL